MLMMRRPSPKDNTWVIDVAMLDVPRGMHLVAVDAGTGSELVNEPVPRSEGGPEAVLGRAFKTLGKPAQAVTDRSDVFATDRFSAFLASFGVAHIIVGSLRPDQRNAVERHLRRKARS